MMRRIFLIFACLLMVACSETTQVSITTEARNAAATAERLGADERGMRQYVLVLLRTGPYTPESDAERVRLFEGHFANIGRRAEDGTLLVAGPMAANDQEYRGVFVFNVATIEEARPLVESDAAVSAGIFVPEYFAWYASAGLVEIPDIHRMIAPEPAGVED